MQNARCTAPHFSVQSAPSNASGVCENRYCTYGSVPWQHSINRQNHQGQPAAQSQQATFTAQINHAALKMNMNPGQMSVMGQHNETLSQSQVQKASCQPSSDRNYADYIKLKRIQYRARSVNHHQPDQRLSQVSLSSNQNNQSQTSPISGHHRKTNFVPLSGIQNSTRPQDRQSNTLSGLTAHSQHTTSFSTSTSQSSSPTSPSGSTKNSDNYLLRMLLHEVKSQLTGLTFSGKTFGSQYAKSVSGSQQPTCDSTAGHITTGEKYTQGKARREKAYKEPAKEMGTSTGKETENGSCWATAQTLKQKERNEEVESSVDPADSLKLRTVQLVNKIVAVIAPISQQASSYGQQIDIPTSTPDSLPLKTDAVQNSSQDFCENMDEKTGEPNVAFKLTEDLPHIPSSPSSSPQLGSTIDTSADSEMPTSDNDLTSGSQSRDISQCENGPVSTTQISNQCQDPVCVSGSTSESPVRQSDDQEVESSENTAFDLSTVPVLDNTLKGLRDLVNSLEVKPTEREKLTATDTVKSIIEMYYDGDKQKLVNLLASQELFNISSDLCVKEMHCVVLKYLEPKHLKMLESCSQILINETTLPPEDFRSSWLNVDGQPADVENVLAEPMSDYNITWCKKVAQSVSESVVNGIDSLAQTGADNPEDLGVHAHEDIPKATTDTIPEDIFHSVPEHSTAIFATSECNADMMILEKGCVSRTPSEVSRMQRKSKKQFSQEMPDEVDMVKESTLALTEPLLASSSDQCEINDSDVFERKDASSNEADFTSDSPDIVLLSSEDARKIFSECFECDQKKEPHQICQEEQKDLVTHGAKNQSDSFKGKPLNDFKFTCPHMTSLDRDSDYFCLSCWNETPLLDIDQDETPLTPKEEEELDANDQRQSGKPSVPVCLESSSITKSIINIPKSDESDAMRDPKPGDQTQISGPSSAQEPYHGIAGTKNSGITEPVAEDLQNIMPSAGTKAEPLKKNDADASSGTKILPGTASPSRDLSCNNVNSPNTDAVSETNDILFSYKQHPSDYRSMSMDGCQGRDESKGSCHLPIKKRYSVQLSLKTKQDTPSQVPNVSGTPPSKNAVPHKQKRPITKETGHGEQSEETKKVRLELYGSNSSRSSCQDDSSSTPVYLTISPSPNTGRNYTGEPSAKQKIYNQWSAAFIHSKSSSSSYKKSRRNMEDLLKSKMQALKSVLKDRIMVIAQKGLKHKQHEEAEEDTEHGSQESKKPKHTTADDNLGG